MNELRVLAQKLGRMNAAVALGAFTAAVLAVGFGLILVLAFWCAALTLIAGLIAAKKRWPRVKIKHYLTTSKAALPALLIACGIGLQWLTDALFSSDGGAGWILAGGLVATAALAGVIAIFEGRLMKSIFELIPAEQRAGFEQRLDEIDTGARGAEGQAADFSALDAGAVTREIEARVIGQDATVEAVVTTAFRRARLAQARPHKPIAAFLFVGSTGAGKTELAKALAAELFGGRMVRIDCNELSTDAGTARLVGAPPGYIGSAEGSQFCREIGRLGTGVILLDEVEKAHPAVLKVLMGLLDEARITEQSTSRTFSARGFLVAATSNAAAQEIGTIAATESDQTAQAVRVKDALQAAGFLPEILARIDAVFPFAPLGARALAQIIERFLLQFAHDAGVELVSADAELLLDLVTKANKTKDYGVREVVRSVENAVVDGLLRVRDQGHRLAAIRVIDGRVDVQPAPAESARGGSRA